MSNGISRIPKVPDEIKTAINNDTLSVFIGAGVSRLVGCKGWDALARNRRLGKGHARQRIRRRGVGASRI